MKLKPSNRYHIDLNINGKAVVEIREMFVQYDLQQILLLATKDQLCREKSPLCVQILIRSEKFNKN